MELGWWVVTALRLGVPLLVLRWPLSGSLAGLAADAVDIFILQWLGVPDFSAYNVFDKYLDHWLHLVQGYTMLSWPNRIAAVAGWGLLAWRTIGVTAFELSGARWLLVVFPNTFEFFFIFYLLWQRVFRREVITSPGQAVLIVALLTAPKLVQEYSLHVLRWVPF